MTPRRAHRRAALALAVLLGTATATAAGPPGVFDVAAPETVAALLAGLEPHPGRRAADALVAAAGLRLEAVRQPLTLSLRVDLQRLDVTPAAAPLPPPNDQLANVDAERDQVALTLVLRPFLAGDLADLGDQRVVDLERAALQARETVVQLEVQAIQAATGLWLADLGVALAERAEALATASAAATERRAELGGADPVAVGDAERALREAQAGLRDARAQRDLAAARLASLVPGAGPLPPFDLARAVGTPPDLVRAAFDLTLADIAVRNADRGLLPTLEAGYTWPAAGGTVSLGIESRTWQPAVSYQSGTPVGLTAPSGLPPENLPTVGGALSVAIAWTVSPQAALEADAHRRQRDAAAANLAGAHDRARLTDLAHAAALASAADREAVARLDLDLRALERDAADARFSAGAIAELARLQAHLVWHRAALAYASARVDRLNAVLDTYVAYAAAPSEVLP